MQWRQKVPKVYQAISDRAKKLTEPEPPPPRRRFFFYFALKIVRRLADVINHKQRIFS